MPEGRHPWIVLVGPDGVGKTTVARTFVQLLDARYTHFVPRLNFQSVDDGTGKRSLDAPRSPGYSALVLGMRTIQAWCFYWLRIRPALRRVPVISDRWMLGYAADPTPLRHSASHWLTEWMLGVGPQPNVVVLLSGEPQVVVARKPELRLEEVATIQGRYRRLAAWFNVREVDTTSRSPDEVVNAVKVCIRGPHCLAITPPSRGAQWRVASTRLARELVVSTSARYTMMSWAALSIVAPLLRRRGATWPTDLPDELCRHFSDAGYRFLGFYLPGPETSGDRECWFYSDGTAKRLLQIKVRHGADGRVAMQAERAAREGVSGAELEPIGSEVVAYHEAGMTTLLALEAPFTPRCQ